MQQYFPLILIALAFVALLVLPARQRKKMQAQQQALQNSLAAGARIMTTAGIHGTVTGTGTGTVDVEIAPGVVVTFERRAVLEVKQPAAGSTVVDMEKVDMEKSVSDDDADGPADRAV